MAPIHLREISSDGVLLPGDVAAELYAARLERGVDLHAVATELRIQYDYLLAIEECRFSDLPGPTYVIGFLRSYAGYLGLDANLLVQRFKAETTEFEPRQDLNILEPYDEGGVPTGALIMLAMVLAVSAYGGWYYMVNRDDVAIEQVPEVPERMVAALAPEPAAAVDPVVLPEAEPTLSAEPVQSEPEPEPAAEPTPGPIVAEAEAAPMIPADQADAPVTAAAAIPVVLSEESFDAILASAIDQNSGDQNLVDETEPAPESVVEPAAMPETLEPLETITETQPEPVAEAALISEPFVETPPTEIEPEPTPAETLEAAPLETASLQPVIPAPMIVSSDYLPREFGQANIGSIITLRAREESWVQVTGLNNELLLTRILRAGDIYHVPNRIGLKLMTGNAGGIEILVGGVVTPSLGEIGKVRRQVLLDPEKLLAGSINNP